MMEVIIIVACAKNRVIGKDNDLIWHLPRDMRFFTEQTTGHPVIMGRRNYFSIPKKYRPLRNRDNIVLTRKRDLHIEGAEVFHELKTGIATLQNRGEKKIFIIGGGQVYKQALEENLCTSMLITHIDQSFEGDTFFPKFDKSNWDTKVVLDFKSDAKNPHNFTIVEYIRKVN